MSLRDIAYRQDYRSGYDDIVEQFFRPSLREARTYWRAVGYFSSTALEAFGAPLGDFIRNGGRIRLVTSVELSPDDLKALSNGVAKEELCAQRLEEIIESEFADGVGDGVSRLVRLLEMERLEIKIATPKTGSGIYHEKIGVFIDETDFVSFTGSSNESRNAFEHNRECIDVYTSWDSPDRAKRKRSHFEDLWNGDDIGVDIYTFPEAARKKLLRVWKERESTRKRQQNVSRKWRHQDEARQVFLKAERGVLNMATGTGKTRTALSILKELFEQDQIDTGIVCTDGTDLLNQWFGELLTTRKEIGRNIRVFRHYSAYKESQAFDLNPRNAILLCSREPVAAALRRLTAAQGHRTLLVHDEVHGLGSPGNRARLAGLSDHIRYRLGLSATPDREYDTEGNQFIEQHIGPLLMTFGLKEAIERGILAPFDYYPLSFHLTDEDRERLKSVYSRKAAREAAGEPMSDTEMWIEIARVYKTSTAKLPVFATFIAQHQDLLKRCIVFVETMEYGEAVLDIIHKYRPDFHTYFSGEDAETLKRFAYGELECLITCHRLSEGIDIRSLSTVILFSSERARLETIQRIGRCLRSDPDDPDKKANIVDFIRERNEGDTAPNADEERRDWLVELSQVRPIHEEDGTQHG
jgi:superfamily II DNA or RNA helicase/HKD family nuclease